MASLSLFSWARRALCGPGAALLLGGALVLAAAAPTAASAEGPTASSPEALGLAEPPALAPPDAPAALAEAERIAKGLRCPVCQGLSVADSNADAARAMFARIHELVQLGYSQEQIEAYFVDRYGAWVQLAPPAEGLHWLLWVAPALLVVVGAGIIGLRGRGEAPIAPAAAPPPAADAADARRRAAILAEVGGDDR